MSFSNAVVIMTSNLGTESLAEHDLSDEAIQRRVQEALKAFFRPEFLNRVDDTVVFHRLNRDDVRAIVQIQLDRLAKRLEERGLALTLTDAAKDQLAADGFDPIYGARPLRRLIERAVTNPLAKRLLSGDVGAGDAVTVDVRDDGFTFDVHRAAVQAGESSATIH